MSRPIQLCCQNHLDDRINRVTRRGSLCYKSLNRYPKYLPMLIISKVIGFALCITFGHLFPVICYIQYFGDHLGRHLGFFLTKNCTNLDDNLIKRFLGPKNLSVEPKNSFLYLLFPEICYIQHFGGHLRRHFGFFLAKNCTNLDDNLIKWFLVPKNLCIEPKNSFLYQLFSEIYYIQYFGGHLGFTKKPSGCEVYTHWIL